MGRRLHPPNSCRHRDVSALMVCTPIGQRIARHGRTAAFRAIRAVAELSPIYTSAFRTITAILHVDWEVTQSLYALFTITERESQQRQNNLN